MDKKTKQFEDSVITYVKGSKDDDMSRRYFRLELELYLSRFSLLDLIRVYFFDFRAARRYVEDNND